MNESDEDDEKVDNQENHEDAENVDNYKNQSTVDSMPNNDSPAPLNLSLSQSSKESTGQNNLPRVNFDLSSELVWSRQTTNNLTQQSC